MFSPQTPAADARSKKARKRQREGDEAGAAAAASAAGPSKKGKGGGGAASTKEEGEEGDEGEEGEEGDKQLVKNGFFSDVEFSSLPLSAGMLAALANLNFSTTTKIQASCCNAPPARRQTLAPTEPPVALTPSPLLDVI